jgi:hypothetical protein
MPKYVRFIVVDERMQASMSGLSWWTLVCRFGPIATIGQRWGEYVRFIVSSQRSGGVVAIPEFRGVIFSPIRSDLAARRGQVCPVYRYPETGKSADRLTRGESVWSVIRSGRGLSMSRVTWSDIPYRPFRVDRVDPTGKLVEGPIF